MTQCRILFCPLETSKKDDREVDLEYVLDRKLPPLTLGKFCTRIVGVELK